MFSVKRAEGGQAIHRAALDAPSSACLIGGIELLLDLAQLLPHGGVAVLRDIRHHPGTGGVDDLLDFLALARSDQGAGKVADLGQLLLRGDGRRVRVFGFSGLLIPRHLRRFLGGRLLFFGGGAVFGWSSVMRDGCNN